MRRAAGHLAIVRLIRWLFGECTGLFSYFRTRNTKWYMKLQSGDPKNWLAEWCDGVKLPEIIKKRNYGDSTQILRRLAWFWSTFLFSKGPRRNVSSFLMFLPVRSFVLQRPCYPAVVSLGTLMGLNARQSEIFNEFKYLSLTRMKPFCTCVKLLHGGRTGNGELSKCPIILVILMVFMRKRSTKRSLSCIRKCIYITLRVFSPFRLAFTCFHLFWLAFTIITRHGREAIGSMASTMASCWLLRMLKVEHTILQASGLTLICVREPKNHRSYIETL